MNELDISLIEKALKLTSEGERWPKLDHIKPGPLPSQMKSDIVDKVKLLARYKIEHGFLAIFNVRQVTTLYLLWTNMTPFSGIWKHQWNDEHTLRAIERILGRLATSEHYILEGLSDRSIVTVPFKRYSDTYAEGLPTLSKIVTRVSKRGRGKLTEAELAKSDSTRAVQLCLGQRCRGKRLLCNLLARYGQYSF